ncbi:hypothetical protein C8R43DRAFT_266898 [Mycena crocata]|nr:hypothetical protein C8R43DRAFT_266898 [Mycena crocata]
MEEGGEINEEPAEYEDEDHREVEGETLPPPPPRAVPMLRESEEETDSGYEMEDAPPPPPPRVEHRRSIPAPPPLQPEEEDEEDDAPPPPPPRPATEHRRSIPPPPRNVPVPVPAPAHPALRESEEETESAYEVEEEDASPPPPPPRGQRRPLPTFRPIPPPPPPEEVADDEEVAQDNDEQEEAVEVPPPLPRGRHSAHVASSPVTALEDDYEQLETPEIGAFEHVAAPASAPAPPGRHDRRSIPPVPSTPRPAADKQQSSDKAPTAGWTGQRPHAIQTGGQSRSSTLDTSLLSPASAAFELKRAQEVLDEEEGDPIDPGFHSPSRRGSAIDLPAAMAAQEAAEAQKAEPVEDPETVRRRTIAERMAKLGGIKFGAAPVPRARGAQASEDDHVGAAVSDQDADQPAEDEEEEERARKERIAAKLAGMGGMRIGMMPFGAGGLPPQHSKALGGAAAPSPPARAVPPSRAPPPPQPQEVDSEHESLATNSEDGVKVEAEESEIEEIRHEDAQEETPPPVPTRSGGHRTSVASPPAQAPSDLTRRTSQPPVPAGRPPVPSTMPQNRRASGQMTSAPTSRKSSASADTPPVAGSNTPRRASALSKPQTQEFVMVDSGESSPPPPARPASRPPPPRTVPPPPPPGAAPPSDSVDSSMSSSSQWELPSIPTASLDFGGGIDTSFAGFEGTPAPPAKAHPQSSQQPPATRSVEVHYSADDLVAIWGRVGVHLCEAATQLYEKSKKSLVGDGTYTGFVNAALDEVPNAARSAPPAWGHLVYSQSAASVQKRLSDIMPGDIVAIFDAKLKGHKGLATYNQTVGAGEPLVGIVSEFEPKKSKIRVFQANQHVGHQTVEAASYRLEDLKSGIVKVYRVLEA